MTTTEQAYKDILKKLNGLKKKDIIHSMLFGVVFTCFVFALSLAIVFIVDAIIPLNVPARISWWAITGIAIILSILIYLILPLFKNRTPEKLALTVEEHFPFLENRLINSLQLWNFRNRNEMGYSLEMVDIVIKKTRERIEKVNFSDIIDTEQISKYSKLLIGVSVFLALFAIIFPGQFAESTKRIANPTKPLPAGPELELKVFPGNQEVIKGEDLTVEAATYNVVPKQVNLFYGRTREGLNETVALKKVGENRYSYKFTDISRSFFYQIRANGVHSRIYHINVTEKPMVIRLTLEYFYPRYTDIQPKVSEENNGDITAIKGTKISIKAESNNALKSAKLVFSTGKTIDMRLIHPKVVKSQFFVNDDFTYHIELRDYLDSQNENPMEYKVRCISDEYPMVNILSPGEDSDLSDNMILPLTISALDDYGVKTLNLKYKKGTDGEEKLIKIAEYTDETEITEEYTWNLSDLNLLPEDVVIYYVEVYDNDTVSGPKRSVSGTYTVRFPSIYEIFEEVEKEEEKQITDLEDIKEESKEVQKTLEKIQRETLKNQEITWEQKKEVESAIQKQKELMKKVEDISKNVDKTVDKMEKNEAVALETLKKMEEIQKLMEEISTEEMRDAMKKVQEAMESLNPEEIQEAMKNMQMNQEEYLKKLDRTLGLLKQIKMEQEMEAVVRKAEELVRRQDELNRSTEDAEEIDDKEKLSEMSEDQEGIKKDTESLQEDMNQLSQTMKENQMNEMASKMNQISQSLDENKLTQDMQQASQSMKQGDFQNSMKQQQSSMHKLLQLSESLKSAQMQMQQSGMEEIIAGLQKAMKKLLYLSQNQEGLMEDVEQMQKRDYEQYTDLADDQLILREGTNRVTNEIYSLSKKSFSISPNIGRLLGRAMNTMDETQNYLEKRRGKSAERTGQQATSSLNQAIISLMESQKKCSQQGQQGSSGMQQLMQQLQNMAQKQQGINQGTQNLMQQMQQGNQGLTMQTRSQMARLAAEQEMVKKSLEQLAKEAKENADFLGRLDDIEKEAGEVAKKLEKNKVDDELVRKQQHIMTRLLDAQRSVRKQDYSRRRESKTGEDITRESPDPTPKHLKEDASSLRKDLLKAMKEGYPMEYEHLIKAYFRALSGEE